MRANPYIQCVLSDLKKMTNKGPILNYAIEQVTCIEEYEEVHQPIPGDLTITSGVEGPSHDPYGVESFTFTKEDGSYLSLTIGSLSGSTLDGSNIETISVLPGSNEQSLIFMFETFCGMSLDDCSKLHTQNYIEDPMGSPSQYI